MKGKVFRIIVLCLALASESCAVRFEMVRQVKMHHQPHRVLAGELPADPIDKLEKDNFKLLIHGPKRSMMTKSFFDFPEAQFVMNQQIKKDQIELSSFIKSKTLPAQKPASNDPFKDLIPKRKRVNRNLKSIKLDKEIEELLPDFSEDLRRLKPKKLSRHLLLENTDEGKSNGLNKSNQGNLPLSDNCSEADQLSGKCQAVKLMPDTKAELTEQKSLETFEKFSRDYQKNVKVSNRTLKNQYLDAYRQKVMKAEQDYQAFLMYANDEYNKLQLKYWKQDQADFKKAQKKSETQKMLSIRTNIRKMVSRLNRFYENKRKVLAAKRKEELRAILDKMQDFYNQHFEKDQIQANEMVSKLEDDRLNKWKNAEKDKKFLDNELLETL